jgi:cytosine/adenosine deaminase-related metal-dependent hydrolase
MFAERPTPAQILQMATEHSAASTGFEGRIGRLDPGMAADMVTVDWKAVARPHVDSRTALVDALVLRSRKGMVRGVWVGGAEVVRDGRVTLVDRDAVMAEIEDRLARPPDEAETRARDMVDRLMPHLEAWFRAHPDPGAGRSYRYNAVGDA